MNNKSLVVTVDMYGCPNRCRHCWLGHMPNKKMEDKAADWIVDYFKPYFDRIRFYSWLREPDFCDDYRERWVKDNQLSIHAVPERYELASFWRIVRDPEYVKFLKEINVKVVQLTFFGMNDMTDIGPFEDEDTINYHWRLQDILNAVVESDINLIHMEELFDEKNYDRPFGIKTEDIVNGVIMNKDEVDKMYDWRNNPIMGLPNWICLVGRKN